MLGLDCRKQRERAALSPGENPEPLFYKANQGKVLLIYCYAVIFCPMGLLLQLLVGWFLVIFNVLDFGDLKVDQDI